MSPAMYDSRSPSNADRAVARLASRQHGVIHTAQARRLGLPKSSVHERARKGSWERMFPGVYRLNGSASTWEQRLMAATLWGGDGTVASHRSAAALFRMDGSRTNTLEFTTPRRLRREGIEIHRAELPLHHQSKIGPIAVTTPARTLVDLAAVAPRGLVEGAVDDSLRRSLVTVERLHRTARELTARGRRGPGAILAILGEGVVDSALERRTLRLLRDAGFPDPERLYVITHEGEFVAEVDLAFPEAKLAIEADGYGTHSGPRAFNKDRNRLNGLTVIGWRVLFVTDEDLRLRAGSIVDQVAAALRRAG